MANPKEELKKYLAQHSLYQTALALLKKNVCPRCVLRALRVTTIAFYCLPVQDLTTILGEDSDWSNGDQRPPCVLCLGILELADKPGEGMFAVANQVRAANYQTKDYSFGIQLPLTVLVRERGLQVYMQDLGQPEEGVVALKDALKWVGGALLTRELGLAYKYMSDFQIRLVYSHEETANDHLFLKDVPESGYTEPKPTRAERKKCQPVVVGAATVFDSLKALSNDQIKSHWPIPGKNVTTFCSTPSVIMEHSPVFFAGRYLKYSRKISQTPWVIDGVRKTETSVQELIEQPLVDATGAAATKFSSSGREDCDVRMMGNGRPFMVECDNPHRTQLSSAEIKQLQEKINSNTTDIAIRDLCLVSSDDTLILKKGETEKKKTYRATVWLSRPITDSDLSRLSTMKGLMLKQKTPVRVLHRRSLAVREREIYHMSCERKDTQVMELVLCTQAGTYIKEFVHGDLGRTQPNVGSILGCHADIWELDVTSVDLEWPPVKPPREKHSLDDETEHERTAKKPANEKSENGSEGLTGPRVRFTTSQSGVLDMSVYSDTIGSLCKALTLMQESGATPLLGDGLVAGNVAAMVQYRGERAMLVSRSGKGAETSPGYGDFCLVLSFDVLAWKAEFLAPSANQSAVPSSDTPLLWSALDQSNVAQYGWSELPMAVFHGHAFETPLAAERLGAPISHEVTLCSTPADREAMLSLFHRHPFPATQLYIRRGHGFFLIGLSVADALQQLVQKLLPAMATVTEESAVSGNTQ